VEIHEAKGKLGLAVAGVGGKDVPAQRRGKILGDAVAALVDKAEQRFGGGVALLGAVDGLGEGAEIVAALEGTIGKVGVGVVLGRLAGVSGYGGRGQTRCSRGYAASV